MGNKNTSKLNDQRLENFEAHTFFTKSEIVHLYSRFESMGGSEMKPVNTDAIVQIPELKNNPFRFRICQVFGTKLDPSKAAQIIGSYQHGPPVRMQFQITFDKSQSDKQKDDTIASIKQAARRDHGQYYDTVEVSMVETKMQEKKYPYDVTIHYKDLTTSEGNALVERGADSLANKIADTTNADVLIICEPTKARADLEGDDPDNDFDDEKSDYWLTFDNFVTMMNTFSPRASIQVKAYYAFQLYDYDGDKFINTDDIVKTLEASIGRHRMSYEKMHQVATGVLEEADLDGNKKLSRTEFNRIIKRMPDFMSKFQFSIQRE